MDMIDQYCLFGVFCIVYPFVGFIRNMIIGYLHYPIERTPKASGIDEGVAMSMYASQE